MVSGSVTVKQEIECFRENEMILASKLYKERLVGQISEMAYYKVLERMCKSGDLVKIAKGTYHRPKVGRYGVIPPSEREIVSAFTKNGTGTIIGPSLYNRLELTTQIPKTVDVLSSSLEGTTKTIRNVRVYQVQLDYTIEIEGMIHSLEVLQNFGTIQDLNYSAFVKYAKHIAERYDEEVFKNVISAINYKKSTISFLKEILNFFHKENHLERYLSTLSEYKHPKMEEIYETARVCK